MKSLALFSLPLLAAAAPASHPQTKRQLGNIMPGLMETLPVVTTVDDLPPSRPDAKRVRTTWGPLRMLPGNATKPSGSFSMDPRGQTFMSTLSDGYPKGASVLSGQFEVTLGNGDSAGMESGVYTHHMLTFVNKRSKTWVADCDAPTIDPNAEAPSGLGGLLGGGGAGGGLGGLLGGGAGGAGGAGGFPGLGAGNVDLGSLLQKINLTAALELIESISSGEGLPFSAFLMVGEDNSNARVYYSDPNGKFDSGYYLPEDAEITVQSDLVNYTDEPVDVFLTMDLEYMPGKFGPDTKTKLMSVTGCAGREIKLDTEGETRTTSDKFAIYEDGYIINGKGHLHDGGVEMILLVNDKPVCTSKASYGGVGGTMVVGGERWETISDMTRCPEPIPVRKGDYLTMTSVYDLKLHPLRTQGVTAGGMDGHSHGMGGHDMGGHSGEGGHGAEVMGMWDLTFAPMEIGDDTGAAAANTTTTTSAACS